MEMTESIEQNCTVGVGRNSYFNPDSLNEVSDTSGCSTLICRI